MANPTTLALRLCDGSENVAPMGLAELRACQGFIVDLDGTLYLDEILLPGALEFVSHLRESGKRYLFLTNNSSRSARDYLERLGRLGIPATLDNVMTSGDATIAYLLAETPYRSAYVVGTEALCRDFQRAGIAFDSHHPDCVVLGFDPTLTFEKLEVACRHLFAGLPFFATHPDKTCITERGLIPDIAATIAACHAVTGRLPKILGKPSAEMAASALAKLGTNADKTAIVGDQLDTDMVMGISSGLVSVLVLSGETSQEDHPDEVEGQRPDLIARGIAQVLDWLR